MRRRVYRAALLSAALALGACSSLAPVRLDDRLARAPTLGLQASDRYEALAASSSAEVAAPDLDALHWWRQFDDPALGQWVQAALQGNVDAALAAERVQQAQALLRTAQARGGLQVSVQADTTLQLRQRGDERRLQPGAALNLEVEPDLWGGLGLAERSAAAGVLRSQDLAQAARLAAASLTAQAYIGWRLALQDQALLDRTEALQSEALRIVNVRVEAGLSPLLDRERARAELASTQAEQAAAAERVQQAAAALQVLAGQRPQPARLRVVTASAAGFGPGFAPGHASTAPAAPAPGTTPSRREDQGVQAGQVAPDALPQPLPQWRGPGPQGRPLDLLRQRPDLRAAEQLLLAAAADVGVAQAALRPRLRLPGSLVFGSLAGGGALDLVSATLAAVLDLTLFDSGAADANVQAAQSRAREAALLYRQTLLQALQQVEAAASQATGAQARQAARERGSAAGLAAEAQAQTLYRAGLTGFGDVLDAQRTALDNQRALLQAQADAAVAAVSLFEALGWVPLPDVAPAAVPAVGPAVAPAASARPAAAGAA